MTTLSPIHLHALERRAALCGDPAVRDALAVATASGNFNARAVERLLQRAHPTVVPEPAGAPLRPRPEALGARDGRDRRWHGKRIPRSRWRRSGRCRSGSTSPRRRAV